MAYKDPEKKKEKNKEYKKEWYQKNKDKISEKQKKYYEKNKERKKDYHEKNKEKIREREKVYYEEKNKEYRQSDKGKQNTRISRWKHSGVICDDFDALYDKYINTTNCEECNIELTVDRYCTLTTRCLDHDHTTGLFRNVLCNRCNLSRR